MSGQQYPRTVSRGPLKGQTFRSRRQQAEASARAKGFPNFAAQIQRPRPVFSAEAYGKLRPREREDRERALEALNRMRHDRLSLSQAAREAGTTPGKVQRHAGSALVRHGGRYVAKKTDRLYRLMTFYGPKGQTVIEVKDSRTASKIGRYHNAVERYRQNGDASGLREFRGQYVQSNKQRYPFITDPATLDRFEAAGELSFVSLYQFAA